MPALLGQAPAASDFPIGTVPPMVGPTLSVPASQSSPLRILAYGDTRFTDPSNTSDTNPRMRKYLAGVVATQHADAVFETGDLPMIGGKQEDWDWFTRETAAWREHNLRVFPVIGNHEVRGDFDTGIRNFLAAFPQLGNHRYYSVQLGSVYLLALDMVSAFDEHSHQRAWVTSQLEHLPPGTKFVFVMDHMPLLDDLQSEIAVGLPAAQEVELRHLLEREQPRSGAHFIVLSGHIHNYERFERPGITYIITGGGGAKPYNIYVRGPEDKYRDTRFPCFNYVLFSVQGARADATMYRVADPSAANPQMEVGERFAESAP
jgi:acid phosphatase type 7